VRFCALNLSLSVLATLFFAMMSELASLKKASSKAPGWFTAGPPALLRGVAQVREMLIARMDASYGFQRHQDVPDDQVEPENVAPAACAPVQRDWCRVAHALNLGVLVLFAFVYFVCMLCWLT